MEKTTGREAQELFTIIKDGNGQEHKVFNYNNETLCPTTGIVEIEAMKQIDHDRADFSVVVRCFRDPLTDIIWGIPIGIHSVTKEIRWQPITLTHQTYFDRSIPDQARKAAVICRVIEMGILLDNKGKPQFKIRDKDAQAKATIEKIMASEKAMEIVKTIRVGSDEMNDFALTVGLPTTYTPIMLHAELLKMAQQNPTLILETWTDPNRETLTALKRALEYSVVTADPQGYWFNGLMIGMNESQAVQYLKPKPDVVGGIIAMTAAKKKATETANRRKEVKPIEPKKQEDDEVKKLKAEIEALKALMTPKEEPSQPSEPKAKLPSADLEDLEDLQKRAKELKIQGLNFPHVKNNPEKLKELILKAEEQEA